ncbi:hypothetical protein B0J13DRAFT_226011 [Dactylonectria estremocensis]|uniref:G-patch domain-containing protein n=1 Tax=Dactylonectria estremocensis TaxID=1079267 RepID=A0A9P9F8S1_9HYPO|nr:hypothetical protein B0J13DRAFT_226011 [Dactylonectria estremocensis]
MNAHALLSAQGWRGTGHSLHKTDDSIGLAKPLLLSRKDNTKGLGQKQHFTSDQWWMNAFDEQLKGLDTSKDGKVVQTLKTGKLNTIDKNLGRYSVYTSFVRGGFLEGTLSRLEIKDSSSTESSEDDSSDQEPTKTSEPKPRKETKEERKAAKQKRKQERARKKATQKDRKVSKKSKKSAKSSTESSDADGEKRRRRARKEEKRRKASKESKK